MVSIMASDKFKLDMIEEDNMKGEIDKKIRKLLCECFPEDEKVFSQTRYFNNVLPCYTFIFQNNNKVLGHVGVVIHRIMIKNSQIKIAGIQNLAVSNEMRRTGLSQQLMIDAMAEAKKHNIKFGLLFCIPVLENFYSKLKWKTINASVMMLDKNGNKVSVPLKNITMYKELDKESKFPDGPIDLQSRVW